MSRILPQLAQNLEVSSLAEFIEDDQWVFEQKLDGNRVFIHSTRSVSDTTQNAVPVFTNRYGAPYTKRVPQTIRDFRFPSGDFIIDGELVTEGRGATAKSTFWAFDIIADGRTDLTTEQRRTVLENFLGMVQTPFELVPRAKTRDEKIKLAHTALSQGYEGLIIKRLGKPYRSAGRTPEWLKLKFVATVDVVVTDVRGDGKESVGYEVYDDVTGEPIDIGRASLIGKEKAGAIAKGDVLEVRYLYVGADGRLYQPTILKKRDDKPAAQCTNAQLRYVNKGVLATL